MRSSAACAGTTSREVYGVTHKGCNDCRNNTRCKLTVHGDARACAGYAPIHGWLPTVRAEARPRPNKRG